MTLALAPKYGLLHYKCDTSQDRNYLIFCARLEGLAYKKIGKRCGITGCRVRQIYYKYLRFIRRFDDTFDDEKDYTYTEILRFKAIGALYTSAPVVNKAHNRTALKAADDNLKAVKSVHAESTQHKDDFIDELMVLFKYLDARTCSLNLNHRIFNTAQHLKQQHYKFYRK